MEARTITASKLTPLHVLGLLVFLTTFGSILWSPSTTTFTASSSGASSTNAVVKIPGAHFHSTKPAADAHMAPCRWVFDHYVPSVYEDEWMENIPQWQGTVCRTLTLRIHQKASRLIVKRASELFEKSPGRAPRPVAYEQEADDYMSRFYYRRECLNPQLSRWENATGIGCELIEPLWGMLRDPFDVWCGTEALHAPGVGSDDGQSKAHILPTSFAPWTLSISDTLPLEPSWSTGSPPWQRSLQIVNDPDYGLLHTAPRNIHLDLGASYFNMWTKVGLTAASGRWFYDTYTQRAEINFDRFTAVEVEPLSSVTAYSQVPHDLVAAYTLMNVPLTTQDGDRLNAIDLINNLVTPGDFFAFKLDIDSAPIELPIAHALRDNKTLASLVTELFFEHHVDVGPMRGAWGAHLQEDMKDSYNLFTALRGNGIRAHSWP